MSYKPDHYAQLTPCLVVCDGDKALTFYEEAFGFKPIDEAVRDEEGKVQYASLKLEDATIMIFPEGAFDSQAKAPSTLGTESPVSLYIYVPDADAQYDRAIQSGAYSLLAPHDAFWGDRFCKVSDPDGHIWGFATFDSERSAQHKKEKH